jgi:Zn-dependent metalloprotease
VKLLKQGLALAVMGAGLAVAPLTPTQAEPAGSGNDVSAMKAQASGDAAVSRESATGRVGFIRVKGRSGDLLPEQAASTASSAAAKATTYVEKYAASFGARRGELERTAVQRNKFGWTVTYQQSYRGVPVFGGVLKANVDSDGDLTSVNGFAAPGLDLDVTPAHGEQAAAQRAVRYVKAHPPTSESGKATDVSGLAAKATELVVYRQGAVKGEPGEAVLAWQVEVSNVTDEGGTVRDMVILDADTLKPVNRWSMMHSALDRALFTYDDGGTPDDDSDDSYPLVWREGDAFPGDLDQDQQNLVTSTGESYAMFFNTFGVDSYDDAGATMVTLHNRPGSCPNASWNGSNTSYCDGVYSDDVVSHEWGHAYTEYNSGLIYQWQSGALNESYSDIWGETLDLLNGREDAGEGNLDTERTVGACSTHSPAVPLLTIDSPSSIAKDCMTGGASFGEQPTAAGTSGEVVAPTTAAEDDATQDLEGCTAYSEDVTGKVVLVNRGTCPFTQKAQVATDAGAAALVIGNNDDAAFGMSGEGAGLVTTVSIGLGDRELIREALAAGETVQVTIRDAGGARESSYRWLIGEKSPAFGGAIRDMWKPTCYGDPGKVSDAEYKCSSDDNGGVHSNSGVPNRGYTLLVDGGTYNGQTVEGIGLDKAANIYFKAQNEYLTPTSGFVDHADSLEAACTTLVNKPIAAINLDVEGDGTELADRITAADCEQVSKVVDAVELRLDPTEQCEWEPILAPGQGPALDCGKGTAATSLFSEDFEDGLSGWGTDQEVVYSEVGATGIPWEATTSAPGGHAGGVAYGPDPVIGSCAADADDISGRDSIVSPAIDVPADGTSPRLSFDHYVATEAGWDGGNVKISVDGGAFTELPESAYVFNGPNGTLETAEAGNTNPMAGQAAWTGTDPGGATGSWGTSVVDLAAAGVEAGSSVQLRFDLGRDGCNGVDGWYVDNVEVEACAEASAVGSTTRARVKPRRPYFKEDFRAIVRVRADDGSTPRGRVVIKLDGQQVRQGRLKDGRMAREIRRNLRPGKHRLVAIYRGSKSVERSRDTVRFRVTRR